MRSLPARLEVALRLVDRWLAEHAITMLRLSLGVVFLIFGALKLFPGVSPAQDVAIETTELLTLGIVPAGAALLGVAIMECTIGLCLLTGRLLGLGVGLLGFALIGILSPLALLTGELFTGPGHAPNLLGQYVIKDLVLAAAALVVLAATRGATLRAPHPPAAERGAREKMEIVLAGLRGGVSIAAVCRAHDITQDEFFSWRDELLDGAARTLATCETDSAAEKVLTRRLQHAKATL